MKNKTTDVLQQYIETAAKYYAKSIDEAFLRAARGLTMPEPRDTSDDWKGYLIDGEYYKPTGFEAGQDQGQIGGDDHVRKLVERRVRNKNV